MNTVNIVNSSLPIRILLIEDNLGDVILLRRAFQQLKISKELFIADTCEAALAMLHKENEYKHFKLPDLILLDLNLPVMSGDEFLDVIKDDSALKSIPVLVWSSSCPETQYPNLQVKACLTKPLNLEKFSEALNQLGWPNPAPAVSSNEEDKKQAS